MSDVIVLGMAANGWWVVGCGLWVKTGLWVG